MQNRMQMGICFENVECQAKTKDCQAENKTLGESRYAEPDIKRDIKKMYCF